MTRSKKRGALVLLSLCIMFTSVFVWIRPQKDMKHYKIIKNVALVCMCITWVPFVFMALTLALGVPVIGYFGLDAAKDKYQDDKLLAATAQTIDRYSATGETGVEPATYRAFS